MGHSFVKCSEVVSREARLLRITKTLSSLLNQERANTIPTYIYVYSISGDNHSRDE